MNDPHPQNLTLARRVKQYGPLRLREGLRLFGRVAGAVAEFHGRGTVHGGLWPGAICLEGDSQVSLRRPGDGAGEAEAEGEAGGNGMARKFVAPERREEGEADTRCDVYSLGKLLHWMLTGRAPDGSGVSGRLPEELGGIISRAIREDPAERTQTISALTDALDALHEEDLKRLEDELELAVSAAGFDPRLLWKRHPRKVLCCVVLALIGALCGGWFYRRHAEQMRRQAVAELEREKQMARERMARERNGRAHLFYEEGRYRDAAEEFKAVAGQEAAPELREQALCFLARSYRQLKDFGAEYGTWMRLMRRYPDSAHLGEANQRIARIASLTLKRYGDLVRIETAQSLLVDGLGNDWEGIEPIINDEKGDNLRGGDPSDLTAFYAAVQGQRMYFRFDTAKPPREGDQFCVAIDLNALAYEDSSEQWDYQIGVAKGIPPWIWDLRGNRGYENNRSTRLHGVEFAQKSIVEFSVPLSALGNPCSASLRVFTNYQRQSRPNDMSSRKVLVEWCRDGSGDGTPGEPDETDATAATGEPPAQKEGLGGDRQGAGPEIMQDSPGEKTSPPAKQPGASEPADAAKTGAAEEPTRPESSPKDSNQN